MLSRRWLKFCVFDLLTWIENAAYNVSQNGKQNRSAQTVVCSGRNAHGSDLREAFVLEFPVQQTRTGEGRFTGYFIQKLVATLGLMLASGVLFMWAWDDQGCAVCGYPPFKISILCISLTCFKANLWLYPQGQKKYRGTAIRSNAEFGYTAENER